MRRPERWTTNRAWAEAMEAQAPGYAEEARKEAHRMFLAHPEAPWPHNVIWPSVVTREVQDGAITRYEVRGEAFRQC